MHRFARAAIAVIPVLAAIACGGRVGEVGGGGPPCPSPSAVAPGVACASAGQVCVETTDECDTLGTADCTCIDGIWTCPAVATPNCFVPDAGPPPVCPVAAAVIQGDSCDVPQQLSCSSDTPIYDCSGNVAGTCADLAIEPDQIEIDFVSRDEILVVAGGERFRNQLKFDVLHLLIHVLNGLQELGLGFVGLEHFLDVVELFAHPLQLIHHV